MALFPDCSFSVRLPAKELVAGARAVGTLDLAVPEPIPRADHVDLVFRTEAWAGYGGGKSRTVIRRTVFLAPLRIDFPRGEPLAAGTHSFPFGVDVPALLGPGFEGDDCGFVHAIDVRLDVDWARDPKETLTPIVRLPPRDGRRTPLVTRTTAEFHDRLVLEVTLSSTTLVAGTDRVEGRLALRGGHDARLDAVTVHVVSRATVRMGRGDVRDGARTGTSIPASALRSGEAVPFGIPLDAFPPTFRNGFLDHDLVLLVTAEIPWASDPTLEIPLAVLPAGSTLWGEADERSPRARARS